MTRPEKPGGELPSQADEFGGTYVTFLPCWAEHPYLMLKDYRFEKGQWVNVGVPLRCDKDLGHEGLHFRARVEWEGEDENPILGN